MEIILEVDTQESPMIELDVFRSPNREEVTRILFYRNNGYRHNELKYGADGRGKLNSLISIESSASSVFSPMFS